MFAKTTAHVMNMTAVPHSGNNCSGLCLTPCQHLDCWQCKQVPNSREDNITAQLLKKMQALTDKAGAKSMMSALPAEKPQDWQKATITRGALEALASKAGVRMDWNNGAPVFYDEEVNLTDQRYRDEERKLLEEKVKELERIASQLDSGVLNRQTARSMAEAAGKQIDTMANDIIKKRVNETLMDDVRKNETAIRAKLRGKGASDADIEAAVALANYKPPGENEPKTGLQYWDEAGVLPAAEWKRVMDDMKRQVFVGTGSRMTTAIVHPSQWAEWQNVDK